MTDPIRVDVWSDVACPWCYIGKRRLEAGIEAFAGDESPDVEVEFHSFQLDPGMPTDFEGSAADHLARHKGIPETRARGMQAHVTRLAADAGLVYDFTKLKPANTLAAHQLLHLAKRHAVQVDVKEGLLRAHFTEGRHVGRTAVLAEIGAEAGIPRQVVVDSLADGEFLPAVQADFQQAASFGIRGVPFFVFSGRYGVPGAQPAETFTRVLTDIAGDQMG
ncbi:MAG: DsbA family oxidoreductase [Acidimicrobiia bacterium]